MFYERKIKYLDYLVKQEKCGNAGFIKLEVRDTICNITINVNNLRASDSLWVKMYVSGETGECELCSLELVQGKGTKQLLRQDVQDIGHTGIAYHNIKAVRIPISAEREIYGVLTQEKKGQNSKSNRKQQAVIKETEVFGRVSDGQVGDKLAIPQKNYFTNDYEPGLMSECKAADSISVQRTKHKEAPQFMYGVSKYHKVEDKVVEHEKTKYSKLKDGKTEYDVSKHSEQEDEKSEYNILKYSDSQNQILEYNISKYSELEDEILERSISKYSETEGRISKRDVSKYHDSEDGATKHGTLRYYMPEGKTSEKDISKYSVSENRASENSASENEILDSDMSARRASKYHAPKFGTEQSRTNVAEIQVPEQKNENSKASTHNTTEAVAVQTIPANDRDSISAETMEQQVVNGMDNERQESKQSNTSNQVENVMRRKRENIVAQQQKMVLHDNKWKQLWEIYPHITPFHDERECLSIGPNDFVILPEKYFRMANNSFLLHGYYNYKHLVLKRMECHGQTRYYLGVPGNFYDREKQVAVMFGFESFESLEEPARTGDYGYYLMRIEL